jgi:kynurenine aminotransferase
MFEPYFDQYTFFASFNGGKPVFVPLHPPPPSHQNPTSDDWKIDFDELRSVEVLDSILCSI